MGVKTISLVKQYGTRRLDLQTKVSSETPMSSIWEIKDTETTVYNSYKKRNFRIQSIARLNKIS